MCSFYNAYVWYIVYNACGVIFVGNVCGIMCICSIIVCIYCILVLLLFHLVCSQIAYNKVGGVLYLIL